MVKELTATIKTNLIEEETGSHRYVLERSWNTRGKPKMATILTLYPSTSELILTDLTTMLITNNIYKLGYDGFYSVNLYSKLSFSDRSLNKSNMRDFDGATNSTNEAQIIECAKKSNIVILAYGSLPDKNKKVKQNLENLMAILEREALFDKVKTLSDNRGEKCFHPLSSHVRKEWNLI